MLGKYVRVRVTNPIGSDDGAGFTYPLNYGTVYSNENQTAFIMEYTILFAILTDELSPFSATDETKNSFGLWLRKAPASLSTI